MEKTMQSFEELARAARTCRRFDETVPVSAEALRRMLDVARTASSCANRQPLRYITASTPESCERVFPHIKWAGALQWEGPEQGERPTGYILICSAQPESMFVHYDTAIAAQTMQLHATELGFGCCMINSFAREPVRKILEVPEGIIPVLLLAFGHPVEERRLTDAKIGDDLRYWRDERNVHYVPKLTLDQVLLAEK